MRRRHESLCLSALLPLSAVAVPRVCRAAQSLSSAVEIAASVPSAVDSISVSPFVSYDASTKTVHVRLICALNSALGGFNFNGGSRGDQTITVPLGWRVHFDVRNNDAIPHSAIVIADTKPIPSVPDQPAFPAAYTSNLTAGLAPQTGHDTMDFTADKAGNYLIACGVPGHATSGMYIRFVVSATATAPTNTGTMAQG